MSFIEKLLSLNYLECVNALKEKYGNVPYSYFLNDKCISKNPKNSRTKEGLVIHHVDEDKAIMLSTKEYALLNPFDYQKPDRLVYCNLLEHLVLHMKIFEFPNKDANTNEICGVGGIYNFLVPELNDIYSGIKYKIDWKKATIKAIINLKDDYLKCIKWLVEKKFDYPLLTSLNQNYGWDPKNNLPLFSEMIKLGVKK